MITVKKIIDVKNANTKKEDYSSIEKSSKLPSLFKIL